MAAAALAVPLCAQQDEVGVGEITGFIGGVSGVGTHLNGGFSFASPTSKHIVPNAEISFSPLGTRVFNTGPFDRTSNVLTSRLYDVNAGVQIRFPGKGYAAPYFGLGIGLLRFTNSFSASGSPPVIEHRASNYFDGNASIGFRYYLNNHVGLRPEIKGYFGNKSFLRAVVGIFYQFP